MKDKISGAFGRVKHSFSRVKSISLKRRAPKGASPNKTNVDKVKNAESLLRKIAIGLIVGLFVIEFAFAISIYVFKSSDNITRTMASIIPYPAAFTTAGVVTVSKYWKEKDYIEHFYASTKQSTLDPKELSKQILQQEAENQIIKKESIAYKIGVSKSDINEAMAQIYESNGGEEEVSKALRDLYGLSVNEFKALVKTQLLRDTMNKEVIKHATVEHILIRVEEGAAQEKIDEAKARLDGYVAEINAGLTFEDAAKKYSEDVGSNQEGGLLEPFARGDMVAEFENVAFATKPGEMSAVFRTSFGWHILKVISFSGYVDKSFDDWLAGLLKNNLVIYLYRG